MKFGWIALLVGLVITAGCQPKPVDLPGQTPAPTALSTDMPEPTHTPVPCVETRGRFEFHKFQTTVMTHPLEFRVYLPPCYDFDPERQYPTLTCCTGNHSTMTSGTGWARMKRWTPCWPPVKRMVSSW